MFELSDNTSICGPIAWEDPPERSVFAGDVRLGRLKGGEQLLYIFDMGDDWTHLCTVGEQRIDPLETLGIIPTGPHAVLGLGRDPRPVRPAHLGRRRRDTARARPGMARSAAAAPILGTASAVATRAPAADGTHRSASLRAAGSSASRRERPMTDRHDDVCVGERGS